MCDELSTLHVDMVLAVSYNEWKRGLRCRRFTGLRHTWSFLCYLKRHAEPTPLSGHPGPNQEMLHMLVGESSGKGQKVSQVRHWAARYRMPR